MDDIFLTIALGVFFFSLRKQPPFFAPGPSGVFFLSEEGRLFSQATFFLQGLINKRKQIGKKKIKLMKNASYLPFSGITEEKIEHFFASKRHFLVVTCDG